MNGEIAITQLRNYAITMLALGACAQASPPPGGTADQEPPRVIATTPDTNAVVPNFNGEVRIKFDESLSERGVRPSDMVAVSPETGDVEASRHGDEIRVKIDGGWQPNRVYHVTVLPGQQDRRGNQRAQSFELVFSTGPEIMPTAIAGLVRDRLTDRPVANARVLALGADSLLYAALTDTSGFFAMRALPPGTYTTTAYVDVNRNRELDGLEPRDTKTTILTAPRDTPVVEFSVLALDTTAARLLKAEARDTVHVRISFDDFISGTDPMRSIFAQTWVLPDSVPGPTGAVMRIRDYERLLAERDTSARRPPAPGPGAADTTRILPTQELVWLPQTPLTPNTRYRIVVSNVRNIAGIDAGGGSVTFTTPARPRPVVRDTTAMPVRPDTSRSIR